MDSVKELSSWCSEMNNYTTPAWDALPDLDLYMDQVITYLERQMRLFGLDNGEKPITPSMINNYVKDELIPRPSGKKYSRVHLVYLLAISLLKQVFPIPGISGVIRAEAEKIEMPELFARFGTIQDEASHAVAGRVNQTIGSAGDGNPADALMMLAIKLTFEANANILAAKRILHALSADEPAKAGERKKKTEPGSQGSKKKKSDVKTYEGGKKKAESQPDKE